MPLTADKEASNTQDPGSMAARPLRVNLRVKMEFTQAVEVSFVRHSNGSHVWGKILDKSGACSDHDFQ